MIERVSFERIRASSFRASPCFALLFALPFAVGCGASSTGRGDSSAPAALERWHTEAEWVLASRERCVTGPFEVEVPDRDIAYGRRFVVEVFGDRGLPLDSRFAYTNGWSSSGWGWSEEELGARLGDHSACQMPEGESEPGEASAHGREVPSPTDGPASPARGGPPASPGEMETAAELPELDRYEGALPSASRQQRSVAWYPRGNPNLYAIDGLSEEYMEEGGHVGFRFRFWFHRPVDATGLIIRIRDQILVPTIDEARYVAGFSTRVAEVDRRLLEAERVAGYQPNEPARGRVPPPPKREMIPDPPAPGVEWLPGHWRYHEGLADFVWIGGTYVVRARPDAAEEAPPPPEELEADVREEEVVTLEASVPPRPEPRPESIPPPPAVPGAQWIAGHWTLRGRAWAWVGGRWQVPRLNGARFRAPTVERRGEVKVYLPGGWTLGAGLGR